MIAEKFKLTEIFMDIRVKIDVLKDILKRNNLTVDEVIYIGDDVNDYDSLCSAKYAITVPTAVKKVKNIPNIQITEAESGMGAFREVVDVLVK